MIQVPPLWQGFCLIHSSMSTILAWKCFMIFLYFSISLLLSFMSHLGKGLFFTDWVTERSKNTRLCFNLKSAVFHRVQEWFFLIPFFCKNTNVSLSKMTFLKIVQIGIKKGYKPAKFQLGIGIWNFPMYWYKFHHYGMGFVSSIHWYQQYNELQ